MCKFTFIFASLEMAIDEDRAKRIFSERQLSLSSEISLKNMFLSVVLDPKPDPKRKELEAATSLGRKNPAIRRSKSTSGGRVEALCETDLGTVV